MSGYVADVQMAPAKLRNSSSGELFLILTFLEWCPEFKIIVLCLADRFNQECNVLDIG